MRKDNKGITLIALVVTIIILLVLAGISIATLSGENGLINRAVTAKENTESAQEIEILQQAAVQAMGKSKSGDVEKQYLDAALANNSAIESTQDSAGGVKVTFKSGREYIVSADGDVKEKATYSNEIKELLKVKNNVSPYVNYIDANGNTITCRVLYDASSSYGIEIISDDIIKNGEEMEIVILGKNDSNPFVTPSAFDTTGITYPQNISDSQKKSAASYNRAITTLNEKAQSYVANNDGIVEYARCVGTDPMNPADNLATYYTVNDETASNGYFKTYGYNSKFKDAGPDSWDQTRLRELNLQSASGSYWYARRNIDTFKNTKFRVEYIISNGTPGYTQNICYIDSSGRMNEEERRTLHSTCFPSYTNS